MTAQPAGPVVIAAEAQLLGKERGIGLGSLGLGAFGLVFFVVFGLFGDGPDELAFGLVGGAVALAAILFGAAQMGRRRKLIVHPAKRVIEETGGLFADDRRRYHALSQFERVDLEPVEVGLRRRRTETRYRICFGGGGGGAKQTLEAGTYRHLADALDAAIRIVRATGLTLYDRTQGQRPAVLTPERARALKEDLELDDPWWRRRSVIALVLANLIPAGGVFVASWDAVSLVILFWAEGWVLGFYALLKILASAGGAARGFQRALEKARWAVTCGALLVPVAFGLWVVIVHVFGVEWPIGAFDVGRGWTAPGLFVALLRESGLWIAVAALFVSHGVAFAGDFIGRGEYRRASPAQLVMLPFWHLATVQLVVVLGALVFVRLNAPGALLTLLVLAKTGVDIRARAREHRRFSAADYDRRTRGVT